MENYAKAVLYAYPLLKNVGREYDEYIRNKALLSYRSASPAWALAETIAEQIVEKQKLEWLKERVEKVLARLDDTERTLLAVRYFRGGGRSGGLLIKKTPVEADGKRAEIAAWSERKYFRRQSRLAEKVGAMLCGVGITEEVFEREYAPLDTFRKIYEFVQAGKDGEAKGRERERLCGTGKKAD